MDQKFLKQQLSLGRVSFLEKKIVLLNCSIVTNFGNFSYRPIAVDEIKDLIKFSGYEVISAVGHQSTASVISSILGIDCQLNRVEYRQLPGHIALVFKMNARIEEGRILSIEEIDRIGYSWGCLKMEGRKALSYALMFRGVFAEVREIWAPGSLLDGVYFWFEGEPVGPFCSVDAATEEFNKLVIESEKKKLL